MSEVVFHLSCPDGWTYEGYQCCQIWMKLEKGGTRVENLSEPVARIWNAGIFVVDDPNALQQMLIADRGRCFLILSGEGATLEDLANAINDNIFGGAATIHCFDGGEETTLKVAGSFFTCECGSDKFKKCGPGRYKCKACTRFYYNRPPPGASPTYIVEEKVVEHEDGCIQEAPDVRGGGGLGPTEQGSTGGSIGVN